MSYFLGIYQIITEDDSLTIKFANADSTEKDDKRFKIFAFILWGVLSFGITVIPLILQKYAHAILFFIIFFGGGLAICLGVTKRSSVKYFSVVIDKNGINEIWKSPENPFHKTILWGDLIYFNRLEQVFSLATKPPQSYDCIVFSSERLNDDDVRKNVRKVVRNSMQYEEKFKQFDHSIFIVIESSNSDRIYEEIKTFANAFL